MRLVVVKDEFFILKTLLLLNCARTLFVICLLRCQHHHLSLDTLINKVFEQKKIKFKYLSTR